MSVDIQHARQFLAERERRRQRELDRRFERAWTGFRAILHLLVSTYRPARIYQWGSLLDRSRFAEYSDIDLAVEGIPDAATFFALYADADRLTSLPLDLVQMERIEPEFADIIRLKGVVVYDRGSADIPAPS
jgi:predicted nucleotidyltransferase